MNSHSFSKPLITIGLLVLMGAVGAQTYYTHELVNRVVANQAGALSVTESAPAPETEHWDSWSAMHAEMLRMQARMEQMFIRDAQSIHRMTGFAVLTSGGKVTLKEQDGSYLVKAVIPGTKESDISVNLDGCMHSISAQSRGSEEQSTDDGKVIRQENFATAYQRAFTLPGPVNAAGMHSQFDEGVLTVTIPKAASQDSLN